jgi:hypothetical protein
VSDSSEGFWIFGFKAFVIVSDDISVSAVRINVVLFVHVTLSLFLLAVVQYPGPGASAYSSDACWDRPGRSI